ncbi:MAG: histidinol-phosphatase HisJ, partial [Calditrichaceae bacterium]
LRLMISDYHIHTKRCKHAEGEMREYVEKTIELQISEIAFTDHIPLPDNFDSAHRMALNELEDYLNDIKTLQDQYPEIKIHTGIEADFYDGFEEFLYQTCQRFNFDISIMSVHFIKGWPKNNWVFSYYFPNRPIQEIYSDYLQALKKGINTGLFDIVGHLDLIKDEDFPLLKTNKSELLDVLKCVKTQSMAVEINTSGLRKEINDTYPNLNVLPILDKYQIPVTFGSDAHKPEQVGFQFETIEQELSNYPNIKVANITEAGLK